MIEIVRNVEIAVDFLQKRLAASMLGVGLNRQVMLSDLNPHPAKSI
jgi:hypothetical protein